MPTRWPVKELESNQCGIETQFLMGLRWRHLRTWIEPMWNWNGDNARQAQPSYSDLNRTNVELKLNPVPSLLATELGTWIEPMWNWNFLSTMGETHISILESNQCGIETIQTATAPVIPGLHLNRTNVELKHIKKTVNQISIHTWIEPMWNWNLGLHHHSQHNKDDLNRTNVELKPRQRSNVHVGVRTWIEPMWNWNVSLGIASARFRNTWIEPMWNWNQIP